MRNHPGRLEACPLYFLILLILPDFCYNPCCKSLQIRVFAMTHCQNLLDILRQNGNRITPQREMIVEALANSDQHLSADELFECVRARTHTVNIATVYRTLELLVAEGLASRADMGDAGIVYATMNHGPHIHLVCRHCQEIIQADDLAVAPFREQLVTQYRFIPDLGHLSIIGLCSACQAEANSREA
jgi:Fur family transcriptional regulator, ferric uptake regulator